MKGWDPRSGTDKNEWKPTSLAVTTFTHCPVRPTPPHPPHTQHALVSSPIDSPYRDGKLVIGRGAGEREDGLQHQLEVRLKGGPPPEGRHTLQQQLQAVRDLQPLLHRGLLPLQHLQQRGQHTREFRLQHIRSQRGRHEPERLRHGAPHRQLPGLDPVRHKHLKRGVHLRCERFRVAAARPERVAPLRALLGLGCARKGVAETSDGAGEVRARVLVVVVVVMGAVRV